MRQRTILKAALVTLFLGATVLGGGVLWNLNKQVETVNIADEGDPLWLASQLQFELFRLKDALYRYADGDAVPSDVELRFNIAWSRINIMQAGKVATLVAALHIDDSAVDELKKTFESMDGEIQALPPIDTPQARRERITSSLLKRLTPYDLRLRDFLLSLAQSKAKVMFKFQNGVLSLSHATAYLLLISTVLVFIFITFLVIDLRASRMTTARLRNLAKEAEAASRAKDKFMSAVSHELRTPLTSIIGGLKVLRSIGVRSHDAQQEKVLNIVERNSERLLALVNDILDAQRILEGKAKMNVEPIDLAEIVSTTVEDCSAYADQFKVTYVTEIESGSIPVMADRDRISQVLYNLLSNAAKFTRAGDRVVVRAFRAGDAIRVEVEDHGIGIAEAEHENVFTRFHQINPGKSGSQKSSGLGLSISKQIVEMHDGEIGFSSALGKGSVFWFTLRRADQGKEAGYAKGFSAAACYA